MAALQQINFIRKTLGAESLKRMPKDIAKALNATGMQAHAIRFRTTTKGSIPKGIALSHFVISLPSTYKPTKADKAKTLALARKLRKAGLSVQAYPMTSEISIGATHDMREHDDNFTR